MPDPVVSSVAAAVVGKAAEAVVQGGKDACVALVKLVRERLGRDDDARKALEAADYSPEDEAAIAALAQALQRLVSADADFGAQLRRLWPQVAVELSADEGGVVNSASGSVGGHLMQARDVRVEGGLHFGDVPRSTER